MDEAAPRECDEPRESAETVAEMPMGPNPRRRVKRLRRPHSPGPGGVGCSEDRSQLASSKEGVEKWLLLRTTRPMQLRLRKS